MNPRTEVGHPREGTWQTVCCQMESSLSFSLPPFSPSSFPPSSHPLLSLFSLSFSPLSLFSLPLHLFSLPLLSLFSPSLSLFSCSLCSLLLSPSSLSLLSLPLFCPSFLPPCSLPLLSLSPARSPTSFAIARCCQWYSIAFAESPSDLYALAHLLCNRQVLRVVLDRLGKVPQ